MPSQKSKFLQTALRIIEEKSSVFKALEDFEKTGKTITKARLNFTIDRELAKSFREHCKKHNLNMSRQIETFMKKELQNNLR